MNRRGQVGVRLARVACALALLMSLGLPARPADSTAEPNPTASLDALINAGRYAEAEDAARRALSVLDADRGAETALAGQLLDRLVEVKLRSAKGVAPETLELAQRYAALATRLRGRQSPEAARALLLVGRTYAERQEFTAAESTLREALATSQATLGLSSPQVADAQFWLGRLYVKLSKYEEARRWFEQSLAIRERVLGVDSAATAQAMTLIGDCLARTSNFREGMPMLRRAAAVAERALGPNHPDVGPSLATLGNHLRNLGEYAEARRLLERVVVLYEYGFGPDSPMLGFALNTLGTIEMYAGNPLAAQDLFERALPIWQRWFGDGDQRMGVLFTNLSQLNMDLHDYHRALELNGAASRICVQVEGPTSDCVASLLHDEAIILGKLGRYDEAERSFARAVASYDRTYGVDSADTGPILNSWALMRLDAGDPVGARDLAARAMRISEQVYGDEHPEVLANLDVLAAADRRLGHAGEALATADRAVAMARKIFGPSHPELAFAMLERARILADLGRREGAVQEATMAEVIERDNLTSIAQGSAEPAALAYAAGRESALDLLVTFATQAGADDPVVAAAAADTVVRSRALVLDELIARRRASLARQDAAGQQLLAELQRASDRLSNLVVRGPMDDDDPPYPQVLAAARIEKERAERALAAHGAAVSQAFDPSRVSLAQVRAAMPGRAALVGFVRYTSQDVADRPSSSVGGSTAAAAYAAVVVAWNDPAPHFVKLGDAASIEVLVDRWRKSVLGESLAAGHGAVSSEKRYRLVATELRRRVWDPVAARVHGADRVFVVADGALNLVNFAALPLGREQYLVDSSPLIHYLSAERDLVMNAGDQLPAGGLLAISSPDFNDRALFAALVEPSARRSSDATASGVAYRGSRSSCGSFQSMRFEPLAATVPETEEIARLWQQGVQRLASLRGPTNPGVGAVVLSAAAANETAFKRSASGHRVLHLATHGFFLGGDCRSVIDPSDGDSGAVTSGQVTRENPLLLSGLVFAGANHRESAGPDEDDGILTAEEIATLDLHGTEWAVLSACDTGLGEVRAGEGVFGLRRAFQLAGANTVIVSLWPVEDEATRQWMTALYRRRIEHSQSTIDAVNGADREVLRSRRARGESTHPFYWAGFIAAGDWR